MINGRKCTSIALCGLLALSACGDSEESGEGEAAEAGTPEGEAAAEGTPAVEAEGAKAEEPREPPPSGMAVLEAGALVFSSSTGEAGFEVPPMEGAPGIAVNVVGEQDGRLVVENLFADPPEHHCAADLDGLSHFRLRMYVSRDDLLPVLTEDLEVAHDDGTKIVLARGVPVPAGASPLTVLGTPLHVSVPDTALGEFFEPRQPFAEEGSSGTVVSSDPPYPLTYDGHELPEDHLYDDDDGVLHYGADDKGGHSLVTVRNPCATIVAKATPMRIGASTKAKSGLYAMKGPKDAVPQMAREFEESYLASPYGGAFAVGGDDEDVWGGLTGTEVGEAFGVGGLGLVGAAGGIQYEVKAGTAVLWPDGSTAGQVVSDHTFGDDIRDAGGRSCFQVALSRSVDATMELCFASGDVARVETAMAYGVGGLGLVGTGRGGGTGEGTIGLGNTGLIGKGGGGGTGSGYGTGTGAGFGGRGKRVPRVRQAKAEVKGPLDKDIIRRIVRAHINEVRYCYNQGLVKDPGLKGRVAIQFTIGPTGKVPTAVVSSSSLSDEKVGNCVAKAVKRWKFPKPAGGGSVVVTYPFVLEPG